jgi:DNA-binding NtrC family response regulator
MPTMSTLITGASGTGKEVVARAIGHSGYIPFNAKNKRFTMEPEEQFRALNLSAMPLNLIESELFGHSKGAFTGATTNKKGWLESCPKGGTLFIDEIGELDESLQIKLLRVLQTRQFQKVGETQSRHFEGRFIAATNRNLSLAMSQGDFRTDFYYRLCSDRIETPSLTHILKEDPEEISHLLQQLCLRLLPHGGAEELIHEAMSVIKTDLPKTYPWPGNFRELEQCVNQVLIRGQYTPEAFHHSIEQHPQPDDWLRKVREGQLNLEALLSHYCQHVYNACGSYEEAARQLNVDRRTIKRYVVLPKAMNDDTSK